MTRASVAVLVCSIAVGSLRAADPAANPDPKSLAVPAGVTARAAELVAKLDDRDYHDRDDATKELRKLGRLALPTLLDTLARNTHPEVRLRVEILLPAATSLDMKARVDCFLADKEGKFQHDLPGAKPFFAAVGRTDAAKQLFSDMIRSPNRDMLVAVEGPEGDLRQLYTTRRADLNVPATGAIGRVDPNATMSAVDMAALLFVEAQLPDRGNAVGGGIGAVRTLPLISNYQFQTALQNALNSDARKEALSAVLNHWMETRDQPYSIYYAVSFMNRYNLPNALPAARKLAGGKVAAAGPGLYRGYAIAYVARFGTADDLPALESLFEDKALLTTVFIGGGVGGNRQQQIQVRDLALAMALTLSKQKVADYGLTYRYSSSGNSDSLKYNYSAYHFEADDAEKADEKRATAVKKYAEWKAAQKKEKGDDKKAEPEKKVEEKKVEEKK
jgi:hypothetical protein